MTSELIALFCIVQITFIHICCITILATQTIIEGTILYDRIN